MSLQSGIAKFVQEQLTTDSRDSKKFMAMQGGIISTLAISAAAGLIFLFGPPAVAGFVATVAQIAITAIGGLVATYIGGQAAVEFRANSVLGTAASSPIYDNNLPNRQINIDIDTPESKPFRPTATEP